MPKHKANGYSVQSKPPTNPARIPIQHIRSGRGQQALVEHNAGSALKRHSSHSKLVGTKESGKLFSNLHENDSILRKSSSLTHIAALSTEEAQRVLSASNLWAVSDPDLSLKEAVPKKSYDAPHTAYAKEKAAFTAWSQKYYYQLTVGCGNVHCRNKFCFSSGKCIARTKPLAAVFSVELASFQGKHLCCHDVKHQEAKVFPGDIFSSTIESDEHSLLPVPTPFLHSLYKTLPFRSLFLPCPLIPSKRGVISRTHSLEQLQGHRGSESSCIASAIKNRIGMLTSQMSSSLSCLWKGTLGDQVDSVTVDRPVMGAKKSVESDESEHGLADNTEKIMTRTRLPSVRLFGPEFAVDDHCSSHAELDEFEQQVAAEMETAREIYSSGSNISEEVDLDSEGVEFDEHCDELCEESCRKDGLELGFSLTHLSVTMFRTVMQNYINCGDDSFLQNTLRTVFSSWESLCLSFCDEGRRKPSSYPFNLKLADVQTVFRTLAEAKNSSLMLSLLHDTILLLLASVQDRELNPSDMKPLLIIFELPDLFTDSALMHEVVGITGRLDQDCAHMLVAYLSEYPQSRFMDLLQGLQTLLSATSLWQTPCLNSVDLSLLCSSLQIVYAANFYKEDMQPIVPPAMFYCTDLGMKLDVKQEYLLWKKQNVNCRASHESILNYPFLLDPVVKVQIIHIDAITQMREEYQNAIVHQARVQQVSKSWGDFTDSSSLSQEVRSAMCPYLVLEIRRDHLIEDSLLQVGNKTDDLKKPLKIKYVCGGEQGLDMGGLQKEFFQIIIETVFDPDYGMFIPSEDQTLIWFNSSSLESDTMFELVGILLGLAIYNGIILDVRFPLVLYKKLLGCKKCQLMDLEQIEPTLKASLEQVLNYDGDLEMDMGMSFEILASSFNATHNVELIPNGAMTPVTEENRHQFVSLYVDYILNKSVSRQFSAFQRGFYKVCSSKALQLFTPPELELLICGNPDFDLRALEEATEYRDGFDASHPLIVEFWKLVYSMDFEQVQALLMFVTGSYRVPLKGLGSLKMVIQRNGPDSNLLPTAMTCFNRLLLPEYKSGSKLKERMLLAIQNAKGFGLV